MSEFDSVANNAALRLSPPLSRSRRLQKRRTNLVVEGLAEMGMLGKAGWATPSLSAKQYRETKSQIKKNIQNIINFFRFKFFPAMYTNSDEKEKSDR